MDHDLIIGPLKDIASNPKLEIVYYGKVNLEKKGDEKTAVRFSITRGGKVSGINFLPKTLVIVN